MKKNFIMLLTVLITAVISCKKEGPWETSVKGKVINAIDSTGIAIADVFVNHWDGDKDHDTAIIYSTMSDSSGNFEFHFTAIERYDFYLITAKKEGYVTSSIEHVDAGSTNYTLVKLFK